MKLIKYTLLFITIIALTNSCKKDDPEEEEPIVNVSVFTLKIDGEEVESNTLETTFIKTYTVVGEEGQLGFNISNNLDKEIKLKMTVVNVEGNGADMYLCFSTCSFAINLDDTEVKLFPVGYTSSDVETHIYNNQNGSRSFECTIKINQVDDNELDINGGKEVFFTYKYVAP